jgi:glutamate synthase domain-containing protein 2
MEIVLVGMVLAALGLAVYDYFQPRHTVLRNFPLIGRGRYLLEELGIYLRQYLYLNDREELPFNRMTRSRVYRAAKALPDVVGFGSQHDLQRSGAVVLVNAPFAVLEEERQKTPPLVIGPGCAKPMVPAHIFNVSAMSFGALSGAAIRALSSGAAQAGIWLNTGEGGLSPYHLEGGCDLIFQIGTAKYGIRDERGRLDPQRVRQLAQTVKAFEIKLSQGAKPGKGGILPGAKVTAEIAAIRGIPKGQPSISPNRHEDIANVDELLDAINRIRDLGGLPVGCKLVLSEDRFLLDLAEAIHRRGLASAPDFITIDGGDGGTGAAPEALADYVGLPLLDALPMAVNALMVSGLKERIRLIASGKLVTSERVAWALAVGADFAQSARGFMFALGCIQSLRCHTDRCPTGVTTHSRHRQRGLVIPDKAGRVANYAQHINQELDILAHSCGLRHAREFRREHIRLIQLAGRSLSMAELWPYPSTTSVTAAGPGPQSGSQDGTYAGS